MKKTMLTMKNLLIAIAFAVFLIFFFINITWFWGLLGTISGILTPFFIGFLIAYILNFPYKFLYTKAFGKMGTKHKFFAKLRKPLALTITYVGTFAIIGALIGLLIPQIISNMSNLISKFPGYISSAQGTLNDWAKSLNEMDLPFAKNINFDNIGNDIIKFLTGSQDITKTVLDWLQGFLGNFASGLYNSFMGIIISIYFLIYKEQLCRQVKRLAVAFIPIKYLPKVYEIVDITDTKCGRFLVGDILDSALIGLIMFVVLTVFGFPYASVIAVFVGVSNIIPFFGPFIGAIPSALILLLEDPWYCFWFIVIQCIVQQLDGNVLKPKIVGNQVGLSSFWVLFSVIVGGALFGIIGFILGTPIFAVIYSLLAKKSRNKIDDKGKIAQQALDFHVLNYTQIAEEQKRIRAEKEQEQKKKIKNSNHLGSDDEDGDADKEKAEAEEQTESFNDKIHKNK